MGLLQQEDMNVTERRTFVGLLGKGKTLQRFSVETSSVGKVVHIEVFNIKKTFYRYSKERRRFTLLLKRKLQKAC